MYTKQHARGHCLAEELTTLIHYFPTRPPPPTTSLAPLRIPDGGGGSSSLGHNQKPSATRGERHLQAKHVRTVIKHDRLGPMLRVHFDYGRRCRVREAHCWPERHVPVLVLKQHRCFASHTQVCDDAQSAVSQSNVGVALHSDQLARGNTVASIVWCAPVRPSASRNCPISSPLPGRVGNTDTSVALTAHVARSEFGCSPVGQSCSPMAQVLV